jgi:hypothetical protein
VWQKALTANRRQTGRCPCFLFSIARHADDLAVAFARNPVRQKSLED